MSPAHCKDTSRADKSTVTLAAKGVIAASTDALQWLQFMSGMDSFVIKCLRLNFMRNRSAPLRGMRQVPAVLLGAFAGFTLDLWRKSATSGR